jgi:diguanylate cyclase (GGDEF)-like protein
MIDLDNFKAYNDHHGHQAGDLVLKEAATAWRTEARSTDLLARTPTHPRRTATRRCRGPQPGG